jgi:hypothetical protein
MKSTDKNIYLLAVISMTQFGTQLSAFLGFASIGIGHEDLLSLSAALAMKTLAIAIFAYYASRFVLKFSAHNAVIFSQIGGILSSMILWVALEINSMILTFIAILLSGIPSVIFGNAITLILRRSIDSEDEFRSVQAVRGSFAAFTFIVAGVSWSWLYLVLGWKGIIALDIWTFCGALLLVKMTPTFKKGQWEFIAQVPMKNSLGLFQQCIVAIKTRISGDQGDGLLTYLFRIILIYIGIGLIPLISSSKEFFQNGDASMNPYRGSVWAVEAISLFVANLIYKYGSKTDRSRAAILAAASTSNLFLYCGTIATKFISGIGLIFFGRVFMEIQAMLLRDQQILKAKTIEDQINAVSVIASFHGLAMAISPLVLYMAFSLGSLPMLFVGTGVVQLIFFLFQWCHNSAKRGLHGT